MVNEVSEPAGFEEGTIVDIVIFLVIAFVIICAGITAFNFFTWFNFVQLDNLNNETCRIANIPESNCFCNMDAWGNVMCSIKQQSSSVIISSELISYKK